MLWVDGGFVRWTIRRRAEERGIYGVQVEGERSEDMLVCKQGKRTAALQSQLKDSGINCPE
jgi:hypothetical protein